MAEMVEHFSGPVKWSLIDRTVEGRMKVWFPHYWMVPKGAAEQRAYRLKAIGACGQDRKLLWKWCREDRLFYLNTFVYIFKAKGEPRPVPFNTYLFQDEALALMHKCTCDGDARRTEDNPFGQEDFRVKKCRYMGLTWLYFIGIAEHDWHFEPHRQFLIGSRNANEVDRGKPRPGEDGVVAGEWAKLLPKIDFVHLHMPAWMLPPGYRPMELPWRMDMSIRNPANGSLISGESANRNFGRSGRYFGIGFDEFAATDNAAEVHAACSSTSFCHAWISTPRGPGTQFALLGRSGIQQICLDWWMHPEHSQGIKLDEQGKPTSPWYEEECQRLGHDPLKIAQELDADEEATGGGAFFAARFVEEMGRKCRAPLIRGRLDIGRDEHGGGVWVKRFVERPAGELWLWEPLRGGGRPALGVYYIFGDIAAGNRDVMTGRGASNSILTVVDAATGCKVAEYAVSGIQPYEFADVAVALARWFAQEDGCPAFLGWENGGAGDQFGDRVIHFHGFSHVYYEPRASGTKDSAALRMPGFRKLHGEYGNARTFFTDLVLAMQDGRYEEVNQLMVEEMRCYVHDNFGHPVHISTVRPDDATGARANHGDRVISAAGVVRMLLKYPYAQKKLERPIPPTSFAAVRRDLAAERERRRLICGARR